MRVTEPETDEQVVSSGWITAIAVLTIVLGLMAIATVASTLVFSWIFIFAGITQIVYAFQSRGAGRVAISLFL